MLKEVDIKILKWAYSKDRFTLLLARQELFPEAGSKGTTDILETHVRRGFLNRTVDLIYNITNKGKDALEEHEKEVGLQLEQEQLSHKKLIFDTKNSMNIFYRGKWIFWMSIISFLISLYLLFLKITE